MKTQKSLSHAVSAVSDAVAVVGVAVTIGLFVVILSQLFFLFEETTYASMSNLENLLQQSMDKTAPPCTNIYQHICGNWNNTKLDNFLHYLNEIHYAGAIEHKLADDEKSPVIKLASEYLSRCANVFNKHPNLYTLREFNNTIVDKWSLHNYNLSNIQDFLRLQLYIALAQGISTLLEVVRFRQAMIIKCTSHVDMFLKLTHSRDPDVFVNLLVENIPKRQRDIYRLAVKKLILVLSNFSILDVCEQGLCSASLLYSAEHDARFSNYSSRFISRKMFLSAWLSAVDDADVYFNEDHTRYLYVRTCVVKLQSDVLKTLETHEERQFILRLIVFLNLGILFGSQSQHLVNDHNRQHMCFALLRSYFGFALDMSYFQAWMKSSGNADQIRHMAIKTIKAMKISIPLGTVDQLSYPFDTENVQLGVPTELETNINMIGEHLGIFNNKTVLAKKCVIPKEFIDCLIYIHRTFRMNLLVNTLGYMTPISSAAFLSDTIRVSTYHEQLFLPFYLVVPPVTLSIRGSYPRSAFMLIHQMALFRADQVLQETFSPNLATQAIKQYALCMERINASAQSLPSQYLTNHIANYMVKELVLYYQDYFNYCALIQCKKIRSAAYINSINNVLGNDELFRDTFGCSSAPLRCSISTYLSILGKPSSDNHRQTDT